MATLCHTSTQVDLALDLFAGPAGSLNCALAVLSGCTSLSHERGDPVVAEVGNELAVGEGISKITRIVRIDNRDKKLSRHTQ
jgi:hypothetical protein